MRRLKTQHSYHDAELRSVEYGAGDCVVFEMELCGCSGSGGAIVHLSFHGVKNIGVVRSVIEQISGRTKERGRMAQIIDLARDVDRRFLIDLDEGPLYIEAKGFTET
jgi:hypothetical protein